MQNKQELLDRLSAIEKEADEIKKIINEEPKKITPEELFWQLMSKLHVSLAKNGNVVFYNEKDEWVIEIENENKCVWFQFDRFWGKFYNEFLWGYNDTQAFLKGRLEKHFKMKDVTPVPLKLISKLMLEKHFKMKDVTPEIK